MISDKDMNLLNRIGDKSRCVLQWWWYFTYNIQKQGWISDRQRKKLESFNYDREMNKVYCVGSKKRKYHWTEGLDKDDMQEYSSGDVF